MSRPLVQISDLQTALSRAEAATSRAQQHAQQEIEGPCQTHDHDCLCRCLTSCSADLRARLQMAEERQEDMSLSVSQATQPLLRQIANLQETSSFQQSNFELVEKDLREQTAHLARQLELATDSKHDAEAEAMALRSKLAALQVHAHACTARMLLCS